ncbi:antiviral reverse transcriptase Drt3b [Pantoea agglomerans]|uniref:antiviral reverse transcriptase Drt3b n=1 Tax=Enterobacter agglomerans TaxID=549 RepID=UPI003C7C3F0A
MKKSRIKLDKKDYKRALLTDTYPTDVPNIFSNDGLYINSNMVTVDFNPIKCFFDKIVAPEHDKTLANDTIRADKQIHQTFPFKYKIFKNESKLRTLSLIHPRSQYNYIKFYRAFSSAITSLCSQSNISIRAPVKIANSFYIKGESKIKVAYKEFNINTIEDEIRTKHASTFFTYKGYDRVYKLFESEEYIALEKKFDVMWSLDVANCFDSIYTHSVSWAIKNKDFIKENIKKAKQFCDDLDQIMHRSNNNETNGIPVGAEFSRIFAELIFQKIDKNLILKLSEAQEFTYGIHYEVLRYVDDYFIFSLNETIAEKVSGVLSDELEKFNLYLGDKKLTKIKRPFLTSKSKKIIEAKKILSYLDETFLVKKIDHERLEPSEGEDKKNKKLKKIYKPERLLKTILDLIKARCCDEADSYSNVAPYLLSALTKKIEKIIGLYDKNGCDDIHSFYVAIDLILKLMFFFHSAKPNVTSSNRLSHSIIVIHDFYEKNGQGLIDPYKDTVMHNISKMRFSHSDTELRDGFTSIEKMNVILSTSEFGKNYLLSERQINDSVFNVKKYNYFFIVSLIYYYKCNEVYKNNIERVELEIMKKFESDFNVEKDSEKAHLFLDIMSCPYVSEALRKNLYQKFLERFEVQRTVVEISEDLSYLLTKYWFVNWRKRNILSLLERKELRTAY